MEGELLHYTDETHMDPAREYEPAPVQRFGKPRGLWFACGNAWKAWCDENGYSTGGMHAPPWHVHVSRPEHVCVLRTVAEFDAFCIRYGFIEHGVRAAGPYCRLPVHPVHLLPLDEKFPDDIRQAAADRSTDWFGEFDAYNAWRQARTEATGRELPFEMDWPAMQKAYAGLVVAPYLYERRHVRWYYGWDVASGVLWDLPRAGVSFTRASADA